VPGLPGLLLFPDHDVVDGLTLRIRALGRDGHRLPVLGDDPGRGRHHLPALFVRAFQGPGIDALEGHRVGILRPRNRIVLAVVLRRVLRPRGRASRVDALRGGFLPIARRLDFQRVTLGGTRTRLAPSTTPRVTITPSMTARRIESIVPSFL
jgi:hypothetical protein